MNANNIVNFDSSGVEHIPKEIKKFIRNKNIIINIDRLHQLFNSWNSLANDPVICGYFCIVFIDFIMLKEKKFIFSK